MSRWMVPSPAVAVFARNPLSLSVWCVRGVGEHPAARPSRSSPPLTSQGRDRSTTVTANYSCHFINRLLFTQCLCFCFGFLKKKNTLRIQIIIGAIASKVRLTVPKVLLSYFSEAFHVVKEQRANCVPISTFRRARCCRHYQTPKVLSTRGATSQNHLR